MTNGEDNATDRMTTRNRTRLVQLQQEIHDALSVQHPDWIEPDGDCPTCESYESRLAKLLAFASPERHPLGGSSTFAVKISIERKRNANEYEKT